MFFKDQPNKIKPEANGICHNQIIHTIRSGDTLFSLAERYNTTVGQILMLNPGTDIYNLQIGASLIICPGTTVKPVPPIGTLPPITPVPPIGPMPPPITPPIGTLPPIAPVPPIGPSLPDLIRELILFILNWIREHLDENEARKLMTALSNEIY